MRGLLELPTEDREGVSRLVVPRDKWPQAYQAESPIGGYVLSHGLGCSYGAGPPGNRALRIQYMSDRYGRSWRKAPFVRKQHPVTDKANKESISFGIRLGEGRLVRS